jgi:hypothetical protein
MGYIVASNHKSDILVGESCRKAASLARSRCAPIQRGTRRKRQSSGQLFKNNRGSFAQLIHYPMKIEVRSTDNVAMKTLNYLN